MWLTSYKSANSFPASSRIMTMSLAQGIEGGNYSMNGHHQTAKLNCAY